MVRKKLIYEVRKEGQALKKAPWPLGETMKIYTIIQVASMYVSSGKNAQNMYILYSVCPIIQHIITFNIPAIQFPHLRCYTRKVENLITCTMHRAPLILFFRQFCKVNSNPWRLNILIANQIQQIRTS